MKVWHSYGSEHSAALVMIGRFKSEQDANIFLAELGKLQETITAVMPDYEEQGRFQKEIMDSLYHGKIQFCYDMSPKDLDDFLLDYSIDKDEKDGSVVRMTTDDVGWAGLIKMMINAGARVEIFSEHNEKKKDA